MKKKTVKLSKEEQDILESAEAGEWKSVKNLRKEKMRAEKFATNTSVEYASGHLKNSKV